MITKKYLWGCIIDPIFFQENISEIFEGLIMVCVYIYVILVITKHVLVYHLKDLGPPQEKYIDFFSTYPPPKPNSATLVNTYNPTPPNSLFSRDKYCVCISIIGPP